MASHMRDNYCIEQIISGGQTGADRAALDWAMKNGIPHGGWCPKGRKSEDGKIPDIYQLQEMESSDYLERTRKNVISSNGTVIFTLSPSLSGGSKRTVEIACDYMKPFLHISFYTPNPDLSLIEFLRKHEITVLNIAGSRASKESGIESLVKSVLDQANRPLLKGENWWKGVVPSNI